MRRKKMRRNQRTQTPLRPIKRNKIKRKRRRKIRASRIRKPKTSQRKRIKSRKKLSQKLARSRPSSRFWKSSWKRSRSKRRKKHISTILPNRLNRRNSKSRRRLRKRINSKKTCTEADRRMRKSCLFHPLLQQQQLQRVCFIPAFHKPVMKIYLHRINKYIYIHPYITWIFHCRMHPNYTTPCFMKIWALRNSQQNSYCGSKNSVT